MITDKNQMATFIKDMTEPYFSKGEIAKKIGVDLPRLSRAINHPEKFMSANLIIKLNEFIKEHDHRVI